MVADKPQQSCSRVAPADMPAYYGGYPKKEWLRGAERGFGPPPIAPVLNFAHPKRLRRSI
jgi:hypothetical protein